MVLEGFFRSRGRQPLARVGVEPPLGVGPVEDPGILIGKGGLVPYDLGNLVPADGVEPPVPQLLADKADILEGEAEKEFLSYNFV